MVLSDRSEQPSGKEGSMSRPKRVAADHGVADSKVHGVPLPTTLVGVWRGGEYIEKEGDEAGKMQLLCQEEVAVVRGLVQVDRGQTWRTPQRPMQTLSPTCATRLAECHS